ncbi:hypothetical protein [Zoogloea sp.]|uniref:hypothetical protein n=1 Tax=Zoogloea sp. TaxID=49181 RepID=UPI0025D69B28|nr:hypothetical protein [Zoogloea sp.]MCK6392070.1 hypothetical protein [Zoogloea sp.]
MIHGTSTQPGVSADVRQQVLELRRRHSFREVAMLAGLPLGTVKAICSRAGVFRDNPAHRALFSLPPIRESSQTLPAVPELPPKERVTGDAELDAVLWLQAVINTGDAALIDKAMEAATRIKTPLKTLEDRYAAFLQATNPGNPFAGLATVGFGDLKGLAKKAIERNCRQNEARARFGDALFDPTPAELFCTETLAGLERSGALHDFDCNQVATRFKDRPELMPQTLADCLHELRFWSDLYRLREAVCRHGGDPPPEATARDWFVFGMLAEIRPRTKVESVAVLRFMGEENRMGAREADAILMNLVGGA